MAVVVVEQRRAGKRRSLNEVSNWLVQTVLSVFGKEFVKKREPVQNSSPQKQARADHAQTRAKEKKKSSGGNDP